MYGTVYAIEKVFQYFSGPSDAHCVQASTSYSITGQRVPALNVTSVLYENTVLVSSMHSDAYDPSGVSDGHETLAAEAARSAVAGT